MRRRAPACNASTTLRHSRHLIGRCSFGLRHGDSSVLDLPCRSKSRLLRTNGATSSIGSTPRGTDTSMRASSAPTRTTLRFSADARFSITQTSRSSTNMRRWHSVLGIKDSSAWRRLRCGDAEFLGDGFRDFLGALSSCGQFAGARGSIGCASAASASRSASVGPSMTMTISPFTASRGPKSARTSGAGPRATSSWSFVSSRQTATRARACTR